MTIAEKLTTIAENQQKVYDTGFAKGEQQGMDTGYTAGHTAGYQEGVANHMRDYIRRCNSGKNFLYAFAGTGWQNVVAVYDLATYDPPEDAVFNCDTNASNMYSYSRVTDTKVPIDLSRAVRNVNSAFAYAANLVTIRKLIVSETTPAIGFTGCTALKNITIEGVLGAKVNLSPCPLLTGDSVQSVIDCLKDLTGADTLTLTLHADVGAALTDAQKAAITAKNWTLTY